MLHQAHLALSLHRAEDLLATLGHVNLDDAPVVVVAAALDDALLLHPIDDPGGAGDRNVEHLGQAATWSRAAEAQLHQHVQVDEAERALVPALEGALEVAEADLVELAEDVVDELLAVRSLLNDCLTFNATPEVYVA